MKKRSKAYWEKRAADRMVDYMADAERTSNTLGKAYYTVGRYLSDEAAKILKSFTDTFGLSESEARQLIGKTPDRSITEKLKKALPKIADKDKRRQAEAMISSPAYSYRIKRLENLGNNVRKQCSQLYNTEVLADDSFFRGLCDDAYKHCIFDMQKGMGVSSAFDIMPASRINRILSTKWSGEHFSARVWGNTNALADGLQNDLLVGIMSGKSEKKMAEDIMNRCAVGAFEARRLVRTEACYIANQAELDGYRQTGIESYEFSAVLDNRTSKLCDNVDGLDGKIFKISEAVPGKNLPPMHPFCRSTTLPILPSEEELDREIAELSDEIGADVEFEEWKENLQETEDGRLVYRAKAVDKSSESGIIEVRSGDVTISSIDFPIEQRHTGKGNPNAILTFDLSLNNRQQGILDRLKEYDARIVVHKDAVNMADLSALTAVTGDEFAMFTKGNERLIIRGNNVKVNITVEEAKQLALQGYKWSGHTHPGVDKNTMMPSTGDEEILKCFNQDISVIYNSKGNFLTFGKE